MFLLDDDEDAVVLAVENRELSLAFDIATPGAGRRELRIWSRSLEASLRKDFQPKAESIEEVRTIVRAFFPRPVMKQTEVANLFSCSLSHVSNLLPSLALAGERPDHSHAAAVTRITRESLVDFLVSRWVR